MGTHLDLALLAARELVVALPDPARDVLPELSALVLVHVLDRPDGDLLLRRRHVRERLARVEVLGRLVPHALVPLDRGRRPGRGEQRFERVRASGEVALALVLDLRARVAQSATTRSHAKRRMTAYRREPAGGGLDIGRLRQLDIRGTVPETVNTKARQGDQELLLATLREVHRQDSMSDLLHDDAAAREARLLRRVSLEGEALRGVGNVVCRDGRVVRDLLNNKVRLAAAVYVGPVAIKEPTGDESSQSKA